jgi:hypothetical protein
MNKYLIFLHTNNGLEVRHLDRPTIDTVQRADLVIYNSVDRAIVVKNRWGSYEPHVFNYGLLGKEEV